MESFANGIVLLGVPAVVLVPLVVEGLKRLGLPTHWSTLAAIATAGAIAALAELVDIWPATGPLVRVVLAAVVLGFGASGAYSQAQDVRQHGWARARAQARARARSVGTGEPAELE